jgi:hypothetical protein
MFEIDDEDKIAVYVIGGAMVLLVLALYGIDQANLKFVVGLTD